LKTFAVTKTNDLAISGRSLQIVENINAVLLVCAHCAKAILGEMVFAQQQGMPYFQTVWVGAPNTAPFEAAFRERIQQIAGVVRIDELETTRVDDVMAYRAVITTIYGAGTING